MLALECSTSHWVTAHTTKTLSSEYLLPGNPVAQGDGQVVFWPEASSCPQTAATPRRASRKGPLSLRPSLREAKVPPKALPITISQPPHPPCPFAEGTSGDVGQRRQFPNGRGQRLANQMYKSEASSKNLLYNLGK